MTVSDERFMLRQVSRLRSIAIASEQLARRQMVTRASGDVIKGDVYEVTLTSDEDPVLNVIELLDVPVDDVYEFWPHCSVMYLGNDVRRAAEVQRTLMAAGYSMRTLKYMATIANMDALEQAFDYCMVKNDNLFKLETLAMHDRVVINVRTGSSPSSLSVGGASALRTGNELWDINDVHVEPAYRSIGVAKLAVTALMLRSVEQSGGTGAIFALVSTAMAVPLYRRLGFLSVANVPKLVPKSISLSGGSGV